MESRSVDAEIDIDIMKCKEFIIREEKANLKPSKYITRPSKHNGSCVLVNLFIEGK
jgi:hypothetical protein